MKRSDAIDIAIDRAKGLLLELQDALRTRDDDKPGPQPVRWHLTKGEAISQ